MERKKDTGHLHLTRRSKSCESCKSCEFQWSNKQACCEWSSKLQSLQCALHSSSSSSSRLVAQLNFNRQSRRISNSKTLEIIRLKLTYFTAHISHQVDRSRSSSSSHLPSPTSPVPKFTVQKLLQGWFFCENSHEESPGWRRETEEIGADQVTLWSCWFFLLHPTKCLSTFFLLWVSELDNELLLH